MISALISRERVFPDTPRSSYRGLLRCNQYLGEIARRDLISSGASAGATKPLRTRPSAFCSILWALVTDAADTVYDYLSATVNRLAVGPVGIPLVGSGQHIETFGAGT